MTLFLSILAGLAIVVGAVGTLTLFTLCIASGANAKPHDLRLIKGLMFVCVVGGVACFAGGILFSARGMPGWGSFVGGLPMLLTVGGIAWLTMSKAWSR